MSRWELLRKGCRNLFDDSRRLLVFLWIILRRQRAGFVESNSLSREMRAPERVAEQTCRFVQPIGRRFRIAATQERESYAVLVRGPLEWAIKCRIANPARGPSIEPSLLAVANRRASGAAAIDRTVGPWLT